MTNKTFEELSTETISSTKTTSPNDVAHLPPSPPEEL